MAELLVLDEDAISSKLAGYSCKLKKELRAKRKKELEKDSASKIKSQVDEGKYEEQYEQLEEFQKQLILKVCEILTDKEWRRRKMQMRISEEEGRLKKDEEETKEMWKRKRSLYALCRSWVHNGVPHESQYGKDYEYDAPVKLLDKHLHVMAQSPDEQLVVVSQVLVADINIGYEEIVNIQVLAFNDKPVKNRKHLATMVEDCNEESLKFDLDYDQESFRVNDKNKEALKTAKHLTKLFPNKVTIQTPQDELELSKWKQLLNCGVEIQKIQSVSISDEDSFVHLCIFDQLFV
ncbi:hypothetical protein ABZP36_020465 [Zizania latifolia]